MSVIDQIQSQSAAPLTFTGAAPAATPRKSPGRDFLGGAIAWAIVIGWFACVHVYWTPAHPGVDQNGYLVGGRMITDHLSTGMMPPDFFGFVGRMWIGTPWQVYYPKYPIGLPVLYAGLLELGKTRWGRAIDFLLNSRRWGLLAVIVFFVTRTAAQFIPPLSKYRKWLTPACVFIAGVATLIAVAHFVGPLRALSTEAPTAGIDLCYLLSPVAMALALVATYQLVRLFAGPLGGILALLTVASSPVTLQLANNPNSHATTFCCVAWGMFLLIRWWQAGGAWRASLAGLLLGYAVTIRYTEGMLVLPMLIVVLYTVRLRDKKWWIETAMLLACWGIPVLCLVAFNLAAFGDITGYDSTNESSGFTWRDFQTNWETTVRTMYNTGLFFILPVSIAGLIVMFFRNWKLAVFLSSWIFPSLILYSAYYWAPDNQTISYMRFYLTILPPLSLSAFWLLIKVIPSAFSYRALPISDVATPRARHIALPLALAAVFAVIGVGVLMMTFADAAWQRKNPRYADSAAPQLSPPQARKAQAGKAPSAAAASIAAIAKERQEEDADDFARLKYGLKFISWRLPPLAGVGLLVLGAAYALAFRKSAHGAAVFGAGPIAVGTACAGLLALAGAGMNLHASGPDLENELATNLNNSIAASVVMQTAQAPDGSVIFGDDRTLHHLQFVGNYQMYDVRQFDTAAIKRMSPEYFDPTVPSPLQEERAAQLFKMVGTYTQTQLTNEERKIAADALDHGRHVYLILPLNQIQLVNSTFLSSGLFKTERRAQWQDATTVTPRTKAKPRWLGVGGNVQPNSKIIDPAKWVILEILAFPPKPTVVPPPKPAAPKAHGTK